MRELKIEIRDADPAYVEEKVSAEVYVHLRAVPTITAFRRNSLERAYALYSESATADADEGQLGALGLLVRVSGGSAAISSSRSGCRESRVTKPLLEAVE